MTDYQERYRPQLHFTSPHSWLNDPNGMVYLDGKYHLFYQYHPYSSVWGPMHWGHAVTEDLVHWEQRPIALEPDELGFIWSGCAVYDKHNSSGLGEDGKGPLVCIYTYHSDERERTGDNNHEYQGLAFSNDSGETWHKYEHNPVLHNEHCHRDFRDPKIVWHEETNSWVMALASGNETQIWSSPNLLDWSYKSSFGMSVGAHGGVWECPDLVRVPVANSDEYRWVLIQSLNPGGPQGGSGTQYFIGDFDGTEFTLCDEFARSRPEGTGVWIDQGPDCYAGVTWSNVPEEDGRVLFLGWLANWDYAHVVPTDGWRGAMTLVRSLELKRSRNGLRLVTKPVEEIESLRSETTSLFKGWIHPGLPKRLETVGEIAPSDLELSFTPPKTGYFELSMMNDNGEVLRLGYDVDKRAFYGDRLNAGQVEFSPRQFPRRHWAPSCTKDSVGELDMRIVVDTSSVEVFFNNGDVSYTALAFPSEPYSKLELSVENAAATVKVTRHKMKSIWTG